VINIVGVRQNAAGLSAARPGAPARRRAGEDACQREAVNIGLIDRMPTRGLEDQPATPAPTVVTAGRFVRDSGEFTVRRPS
jgi:hypothetical protein